MSVKTLTSIFCAFALALVSCNSNGKSADTEAAPEQPLTVDSLLAQADNLVDSLVTFEGVCTHTCKHGATKMFVMGSDESQTVRVEAGELGSFDTKVVNSNVTVTGHLREERIDEAYLAQWEEKEKAAACEKHGDGKSGCASEKAARNESGNTAADRIADFRAKIADNVQNGKNPWLSFYYVEATSYDISE